MVLDAYRAYELGRKSAESLAGTLEEILCCPGDRKGGREGCRDTLARLAPYLAGARDCESLERALDLYLAWLSLRWAYRPCGEPPSTKKPLILQALCSTQPPVPEDVFREALGEPVGGSGVVESEGL